MDMLLSYIAAVVLPLVVYAYRIKHNDAYY